MTKDEIVAIIKECAAELGYVPNIPQLEKTGRITRYHIDTTFGSYMAALEVCGLKGVAAAIAWRKQSWCVSMPWWCGSWEGFRLRTNTGFTPSAAYVHF